jgi:hypothetical protein
MLFDTPLIRRCFHYRSLAAAHSASPAKARDPHRQWTSARHLRLLRRRMIVVRIGKDHSHATSQQLADGCLSRTAHAHQHDDHAHPKKIGSICRSNRFAVKFFATIFQWQPIDRPRILHHRQKLVRTGKRSLAKCMLKQLTSTLWRTDVLPSESAHIVCSSS